MPPLPRLVPVEPRRVTLDDGTEAIVLRDPSGVIEPEIALTPPAFWLAAQLDGRRDAAAIAAAARAEGFRVDAAHVHRLADALRRAGWLDGPEHAALRARAAAAFRAGGLRAPSCAGGVYPDAPVPLRAALDRWIDGAAAAPWDAAAPTLVVAPHIDYPRGAAGYAGAARALAAADADLFVVFGTAHASPRRLFTLTRLDYDTPLGAVETDRAVVDALAAALGPDEVFGDELCHRDEHSVELPLVVLAHVRRRPFRAVPVLCSGIGHLRDPDRATAPFLAALARATAGRRVCFVAGADLAHVGPMYGDARPPTPAELAALEADDRRTLGFLARGDAEGFLADARRDEARRRICGTAPIYAAMKASGAAAPLLRYGQWSDGTDSVSWAAAAG